jgi:hypothetical protein
VETDSTLNLIFTLSSDFASILFTREARDP